MLKGRPNFRGSAEMPFTTSLVSAIIGTVDLANRQREFERLADRYGPRIQAWCERHGLRRDDAKDLTQDVLLKLWTPLGLGQFDRKRGVRFRTWLRAVVKNAVLDAFAAGKKRKAAEAQWGVLHQIADAEELDRFSDELTTAIAPELVLRLRALKNARTRFKYEHGWAAAIAAVRGETPKTIAPRFGIENESYVRKLEHECRKRLHEEYIKLTEASETVS